MSANDRRRRRSCRRQPRPRPSFADGPRVVGVPAHQGRQSNAVESTPVTPASSSSSKRRFVSATRPNHREHPHRPELVAVHRRVCPARVRVRAGRPEVGLAVDRVDRNAAEGCRSHAGAVGPRDRALPAPDGVWHRSPYADTCTLPHDRRVVEPAPGVPVAVRGRRIGRGGGERPPPGGQGR